MVRTLDNALSNLNKHILQVDALNTTISHTTFTPLYKQQQFQIYTVAGQRAGQFKNAGLFAYIRIYGADHEISTYRVSIYYHAFSFCGLRLLQFGHLAYDRQLLIFLNRLWLINLYLQRLTHAN